MNRVILVNHPFRGQSTRMIERRLEDRSLIAIEIKANSAPSVSKGFHQAVADLKPSHAFVAHSGEGRFPMKSGIEAIGLPEMMTILRGHG